MSEVSKTALSNTSNSRQKAAGKRILFADNLKGVLITLVVVGHLLEHCNLGTSEGTAYHIELVLWNLVYSFHMPAFALITGYLAKDNAWTKSGVRSSFWLLALFLFATLVHALIEAVFCTPRIEGGFNLLVDTFSGEWSWSLWWFISLVIWRSVLPAASKLKEAIGSWAGVVVLSFFVLLLAKYSIDRGYHFGLMRTFHFWPFFLIGHILRTKDAKLASDRRTRMIGRILFCAIIAALAVFFELRPDSLLEIYPVVNMFGSYSFLETYTGAASIYNETPFIELEHYAFFWVVALVLAVLSWTIVPKKECFLTSIGRHSLNIYLVHIFVLMILLSDTVQSSSFGAWLLSPVPFTILCAVIILICGKGRSAEALGKWFGKLRPPYGKGKTI